MTNLYKNKIPIKNVYYMLSYAYDFLEYEELNHLGEEQFDNIYEMLSIILLQGIYSQIKKGLTLYFAYVIVQLMLIVIMKNIVLIIYSIKLLKQH